MRKKVFALLVTRIMQLAGMSARKVLSNRSNGITIMYPYFASSTASFLKCAASNTCAHVYHSAFVNIIGEAVIIRIGFHGMELSGVICASADCS